MNPFIRLITQAFCVSAVLASFSSCKKTILSFPEKSEIFGLATPIPLDSNKALVVMEDFFANPTDIDSVAAPAGFEGSMAADKKMLSLIARQPSILSELRVKAKGFWYSLAIVQKNRAQTDLAKVPRLFTNKTTDNQVEIAIENTADSVVVLWENYRIKSQIENGNYIITIPDAASNMARSHIRVLASNAHGLGNDLLIPLQNGKVVNQAAQLNRSDWQAASMYFVFVDRFVDGDSSNTKKVNDTRVLSKANYYGGDLAGILKKLKEGYFKNLGMSTIWVSPITQNPEGAYQEYPEPHRWFSGYHGYWPISLSKIDHRFGNDQVLKEIVTEAHKQGINVLLDYVANHLHSEHPITKQHPDWITPIDLPDGRKNIRLWDEQRLTTWFEPFMPDIDYTKPQVVEAMTDSAMYWIKTFDLDGFRHDATKHVPEQFWRRLTQKLKQQSPEKKIYQIGETFGSRELIGSYINSGMQDAQFDFNVYFDAREVFAKDTEGFERMANSLKMTLNEYGHHHLMGNITGNHDLPRFIAFASEALRWDEDPKEAGWQREIKNENPVGYQKLKMLEAFLAAIPGIPVVYQGDDIGQPGANDPDNRRWMKFENLSPQEQDVKASLEKLMNLRRNNLALSYGDFEVIEASPKTMILVRSYFGKGVAIAFNKDTKAQKITLSLPKRLAQPTKEITLKPMSFEIIEF